MEKSLIFHQNDGLTPLENSNFAFFVKLKFFHLLYLLKIDQEGVFADVLDKKEAFKDYKNNCLRKTQN